MKILLSAYACNPGLGSEEGNGFNWLWETASLGHEVWCLTTPRGKENLEKTLAARAAEPAAARIHPVYITVPKSIDYMYRWQFGVYLHYIAWQYYAWREAKRLDQKVDFDLVHHVTYNSLQMASWLWRLKKPLLLGPLGGGMQAPASLRRYLPDWFKTETMRNIVAWLLTTFDPNVRQSLRHAALVLAANRDTAELAKRLGARKVELAMSAGQPLSLYTPAYVPRPALESRELRIMWLARVYPRKGLHLVLEALGKVDQRVKFHLDILGDGPVGHLVPGWIAEAGLQDRVTWHGKVPYDTIREQYLNHDLFMLCTLRDTYAVQFTEAMALGCPILTLDLHANTDFVPDTAGIKVPVSTPEETSAALARAVEHLYDNPAELERLGRGGFAYAAQQSWPALVSRLLHRAALASHELAGLAPEPTIPRLGLGGKPAFSAE
ncbi:glycosyltransferase family 4 protein [Hymenobacter sp. GOD-10R]|uniref:glycosyltransferase family 4 protein n=1 Tax=Hymenobacter sp. GOD-10R TaxID=3093922 RepID=UPI002D79C6E6|nr:glycosyltransferase family 4 protein [Hymenobacter sp. GOD-10R]WRQ30077.1 glycosyltransferase family 4 protein [Hymenobacter sp. GOD-10R]